MPPDRHRFDYVCFPTRKVPVLTICASSRREVCGAAGNCGGKAPGAAARGFIPTRAKITIGGVDIQQIDRKYLRSHVGLMLQALPLWRSIIDTYPSPCRRAETR